MKKIASYTVPSSTSSVTLSAVDTAGLYKTLVIYWRVSDANTQSSPSSLEISINSGANSHSYNCRRAYGGSGTVAVTSGSGTTFSIAEASTMAFYDGFGVGYMIVGARKNGQLHNFHGRYGTPHGNYYINNGNLPTTGIFYGHVSGSYLATSFTFITYYQMNAGSMFEIYGVE